MGRFLDEGQAPIAPKRRGRFLDEPVGRGEQAIANRQSFIDVNRPITGKSFVGNPLGEGLRALGGGFEVAEGVPASIGMDLQKTVETGGKSLTQIPQNIGKVLTGQRPAQFGDIYREAGAPEPVAATGGFLASLPSATPQGALGGLIGKAIGMPIKGLYNASKPAIGGLLHILSGTPKESIKAALDNPKLLSGKYMKRFKKSAGEGYEREVKPLTDDPNAVIPASGKMQSIGKDLDWFTPQGGTKRALSEVSESEAKKLKDWAVRIDNGKGGVDFNEADKVIAEIDESLGRFYEKKHNAAIPPINKSFQNQALHIRRTIDEGRKTAFPKAGAAIDDYAKYAKERQASRDFSRIKPRFIEGIGGGIGGIGLGFLLKSLPLGAAAFSATSPAMQGLGIRAGAKTAQLFQKNPALAPMTMKALSERRKKK